MDDSQTTKCHAIIHAAALATGAIGAGLAQFPGSDNLAIVPIQIGMIVALGAVFDIQISKSAAQGAIEAAAATVVGRGISQALVGWIPVIGNAINATTAAALTESIGWIAANSFDEKGALA